MVTYDELARRAVHLNEILNRIHADNSDFAEDYVLLSPVIEAILQGRGIPGRIPNSSFFYRLDQEHDALHGHVNLMNAIAKLDAGLEEFHRKG